MDLIQQWCVVHAEKTALVTPTNSYTWQQLDEEISQLSLQLKAQGVSSGHIIAVISKNEPEAVFLYLAALRIGALCALMPPQPMVAIKQKLDIIQAKFIWVSKSIASLDESELNLPNLSLALGKSPSLDRASINTTSIDTAQPYHFNSQQFASIVFTSGSTGTPKAVVHAVKHHIASAQGLTQEFLFDAQDSWLLSLPIYHVSGLSIIWRWLAKGAKLVIGSGDLQSDIQQVTHASLVPVQLQRLLDSGQPIPLKRVLLGGSHIPLSLTERASKQGIECWLGYGMTETASTVIAKQVDANPTAGALLPFRKIKLHDGRIYVAGAILAAGYLFQGQLTPLVTDDQPWFDTKDLGQCYQQAGKPDEYIILGRADNQFISGGENIHCEEIEAVLVRHPDIKQALIIPVEDKQYGHRPVAFIDTETLQDPKVYQAYLLSHLDKFKCPDAYYLLPAHLMNSGIKISRADLKKYYQQVIAS
ncbi:MAG: o-succinylbenzoate--CoA ligase [Vibrio litoralis]|uniref:o-succinylbenzoate--CoA ligase n=1 Tax=Vibrio litoralis TaxID=335972 RepID=UPI003F9CAF53